jgi:hypothetical protein
VTDALASPPRRQPDDHEACRLRRRDERHRRRLDQHPLRIDAERTLNRE